MNTHPLTLRRSGIEAAIVSALVVLAMLLPQAHFGYSTRILDMGDEGLLWYVSQRTAMGDIPLRDYFSYDPGRYYWSAAVFKVMHGDGLFEQILADDLFGLIGLFVIYFAMCRRGIDRRWRLATLLLLGLAMGFPRHKIYEQTLSLIAVAAISYVLSNPSLKAWFCFGIATGLAAFVGRNSGLYFVIAALLTLALSKYLQVSVRPSEAWRGLVPGILIGYLPMFVMLLAVHNFPSAVWQSIQNNAKQLVPVPFPFPWRLHALGLTGFQPIAASFLFMLAPLTYAALLLILPKIGTKSHPDGERKLALGASIVGIPYLFHALSYARFGHIAQATLPFIVASAATSAYFYRVGKRKLSLCLFIGLAAIVAACWIPRQPILEYARARKRYKPIQIHGKQFLLIREDADLLRASQIAFDRCGAREGSFLASPTYPSPYAFLRTRSPFWEVYFILFRLPPSEAFQQKHIQELIDNRISVVLLNQEDKKGIQLFDPELGDYLASHYQPLDTGVPLGDFEMYYTPQLCGK